MTRFFNFELDVESYANNKIVIDESIVNRVPDDYREFLESYKSVRSTKFSSIKIDLPHDEFEFLLIYTMPNFLISSNRDNMYPEGYIAIAEDYQFESVFMSLNQADFGHIYYMPLETWQDYIMGQPVDIQNQNIQAHAIHIADSFTEFASKLYIDEVDIKYEIN